MLRDAILVAHDRIDAGRLEHVVVGRGGRELLLRVQEVLLGRDVLLLMVLLLNLSRELTDQVREVLLRLIRLQVRDTVPEDEAKARQLRVVRAIVVDVQLIYAQRGPEGVGDVRGPGQQGDACVDGTSAIAVAAVELLPSVCDGRILHHHLTVPWRRHGRVMEMKLSNLGVDAIEVLDGDLPCHVVIEEAECLLDLAFRVPVQDLVRHNLQGLLVLNHPAAIVVDV